MRALRVMRVLLPAVLVVLALALLYEWRPRTTASRLPAPNPERERARAEGVSYQLFKGGIPALSGTLDMLEEQRDGRVRVEGVRGLEVQRTDRGPLVIDAERGEGLVDPGSSLWDFERQVVLRDPDEGLELRLPGLEVDEAAGEARAEGEIRFSGPAVTGRATRLVYGLRGQPSELWGPVLVAEPGSLTLSAQRALLLDGLADIEWRGSVNLVRDDGLRLDAGRLRLRRTSAGRPLSAIADGGASGRWPFDDGTGGRFRAERLESGWDADGEIESLRLAGDAELTRGTGLLAAGSIDLRRVSDAAASWPWRLVADGGVVAEGPLGVELATLRAGHVVASLASDHTLRAGEATGGVVFDTAGTRAEAARARFDASDGGGLIELSDDPPRKARLAREQTRVAADLIRTDPAGTRLDAEGRVEATLLPGTQDERGAVAGLFELDDAVNFVAQRMSGRQRGAVIRFEGQARGWQGERNLAANSIVLDQRAGTLTATDEVSCRLPRGADGPATSTADYLQIAATRLVYDDAAGRADYSGEVRLSVIEGWIESERLTIELDPATRRASRIESIGGVRLEWRTDGTAVPISGSADRAIYEPARATITLIGEDAPAAVTRAEGAGGRTTGRILTYHMVSGTLEVESGESGTGRIRTGGSGR